MISGPVVVSILEGEGAVLKNRDLMGATNPKEAKAGQLGLILLRVLTLMLFMEAIA